MKLRERIIALAQSGDYTPKTKNQLSESLGLGKKDRRKLDHELRLLTSQGRLIIVKGDRYCIPGDVDLTTGVIRFRQNGSGFVIPDETGSGNAVEPIEIDTADTGVSMHEDRVVVRLYEKFEQPSNRQRRGRRRHQNRFSDRVRGRVIRIQKRARKTIVGNLQKTRFFHYVVPDDPRIVHDIYVPDPKKAKVSPTPKVGSKVVVKLHEWEQRHVNPEGEIIENLGDTHEPQAELQSILHKYELNPEFPEAVMNEAKGIPQKVHPNQIKGRSDLREVYTLTIDPDDAKDFDDALSFEQSNNTFRIGIHIADVASYVRPESALDKEARARGNSTYLVGKVIPMLPHALSNGVCSLVEDEDRLTKSVFLSFTPGGKFKGAEFANSVIRSNKRLTYKQAYTLLFEDDINAARKLQLPPSHQTGSIGRALADLPEKEISLLQTTLRKLWKIASKLRSDRMRTGSLDLDMSETKIFVDENGYADRLEKVANDESHQLIEEFMLAANEAVAKAMRGASLPCIYRTHDDPDEDRLNELRDYLATFGVTVADLSVRSEMIKLTHQLDTHPQSHILKSQLLRSLKKACYRSTPDGHYGLNKKNYTHFTSPIRRYSDLAVHRVFEHYLVKVEGHSPLEGASSRGYTISRANTLAEHLSHTEVNSTEAERESVKVKLLEFFERELEKPKRTQFTAVITEVRNHGMFIELVESNAFGMVHISTLKDDLYRVNDSGTAIVGRRTRKTYRVGQKANVLVHRVDRFKRQVDFRISD